MISRRSEKNKKEGENGWRENNRPVEEHKQGRSADLPGREPRTDVDPDLAVCLGATVRAGILTGDIAPENSLILTDCARYGLGVEIVDVSGGTFIPGVYSPLIMPHQTIPYSCAVPYSLMHSEQESVEIHLFQDRTGKATRTKDTVDTGISGTIRNIPPSPSGEPHSIEVEFSGSSIVTSSQRGRAPIAAMSLAFT